MSNEGNQREGLRRFRAFIDRYRIEGAWTHLWRPPDPPPIQAGMHCHDHWEVRLELAGPIAWPDRPAERHPPALILPPGTMHQAVQRSHCGAEATMLVLTDQGQWTLSWPGGHYRRVGHCGEAVERRLGASLTTTFEHLARDWRAIEPDGALGRFWENRMRCVLLAFLLGMGADAPAKRSPRMLVERASRYIEQAYVQPDLTVAQIAAACDCSPTHLANVFRRHRGRGVRQALIERRLDRARELLAGGRCLVKEAAYMTGWRSAFHFSNSFEQRFGHRPSEAMPNGERADAG